MFPMPYWFCLCGTVVACMTLNSVDRVLMLQHGFHCVIEAGGMCTLMVAVTSGRLVH